MWQHKAVEQLRGLGAHDVAYYTVPVATPADRRMLSRRAYRKVRLLHSADTLRVPWQHWNERDSTELDFLLCFMHGDEGHNLVASNARFGSWCFSPGPTLVSGILDQFLRGESVTTVTLHRSGPSGFESASLHEGVFRCVPDSFPATMRSVLTCVVDWPLKAALAAMDNGSLPGRPPSAAPSARHQVTMRSRSSFRMVRARARAFRQRDVWNVGIAPWPTTNAAETHFELQPTWLPDPPQGRFLADPFLLRGGKEGATLIAEDFDFKRNTGQLVTFDWDPIRGVAGDLVLAFRLPHHSSYPFLVNTPEGTYCVPECLRSNQVAAWRLHADGVWTKAATLVEGRRLVDPTVTFHDGRWWLFATDEDRGADTSLYCWYADSFTGVWRPHHLNPLKTDVRSSRPAGPLFRLGDRLVRPAQDCSRTYGGQITLNEVLRLDEQSFEERVLGAVRIREGSRYPEGPHTLSFLTGGLVLIDGKRRESADLIQAAKQLPRRVASRARRATVE